MKSAAATTPTMPFASRGAAIVAVVFIALVVALTIAGAGAGELLYRVLVDGAFLVAWLSAGYGIGWLIIGRIDATIGAALKWCIETALGLGVMSLLTLGLGLAGAMNRLTAIVIVAAGAVVAIARAARSFGSLNLAARARWHWLWVLAAPVLGIALVAALLPPGVLWGDEPHGYDVVEYHLQVPREWYDAGRIVPLRHNVFSYMTMGIEMHYLLAMELRGGPWAGMYLAQLMNLAMAVLTALSVYSLVRDNTSELVACIAGVLVATTPWLGLLGPVAYTECALMLYATLSIGLLLRGIDVDRRALAILAGVFAGLACGAKLTGLPMVLIALPFAALVRGTEIRRTIVMCFAYLVVGAVVLSPWLIRTAVWTHGNPVFPEAASVLGKAHWSDAQVQRWWQANHLPGRDQRSTSARVSALWHQVIADYSAGEQIEVRGRYGYVLLPLALVAALMTWRSPRTRALALLLILWLVSWTLFSHLQSRFLVLTIPVAAMLIGEVRWPAWSAVGTIACLVSAAWCWFAVGGKLLAFDRRIGGLSKAIGLEDLRALQPVDLSAAPADARIILIGDARAFLYPMPMSRLSYTTVFDVVPNNDAGLTAWRAIDQSPPAQGSSVYVVDPSEWARLSRTYWKIPPPPPEVAAHSEVYIVMR